MWYAGTRAQARAAVRAIDIALGNPRAGRSDGSALTTRWATPRPITDGRWVFAIDVERAALLPPADQARVIASLPIARRLDPVALGLGEPFVSRAPGDLPDELELLSEDRWHPVVVRARFQHSALPALAGATTLYDGSGSARDLGTQYTRADGLTWVVQPIVTLAAGVASVEFAMPPNTFALGLHTAHLIVTWGDGERTWPDPERSPAISLRVLDRP